MDKESGKKGVYGFRGGSRTAATSKMERFVILNNGFQPSTITTKRSILDISSCWMLHLGCFQPLTIITKRSILDIAAALDSPLSSNTEWNQII